MNKKFLLTFFCGACLFINNACAFWTELFAAPTTAAALALAALGIKHALTQYNENRVTGETLSHNTIVNTHYPFAIKLICAPKTNSKKKLRTEKELSALLDSVSKLYSNHAKNTDLWLEKKAPQEADSFVQKAILPENALIRVHSDIHGDIETLNNYIETLHNDSWLDKKTLRVKQNHFLVFTGDYVDRDKNGIEVICTLAELKKNNPQNVFLIKGNHENINMNIEGGFFDELIQRQFEDDTTFNVIKNFYKSLPQALWLGYRKNEKTHFGAFFHGAPQSNHSSKMIQQLLSDKRNNLFAAVSNSNVDSYEWNDVDFCDIDLKKPRFNTNRGCGLAYPIKFMKRWLKKSSTNTNKVHFFVKGHGHKFNIFHDQKHKRFGMMLNLATQQKKYGKICCKAIVEIACTQNKDNWKKVSNIQLFS